MKLSAGTLGVHIGIFVWCIFMGITAVSIGVGAIWPPLNLVARPFVCPNGAMTFNQETSNPLPGTTYTITGWTCTDQSGEAQELDLFSIALPAGVIYGLVLELVALGLAWYLTAYLPRRNGARSGQPAAAAPYAAYSQPFSSGREVGRRGPAAPDAVARMKELQALRDQDLISQAQFDKKREEILREL